MNITLSDFLCKHIETQIIQNLNNLWNILVPDNN